MDFDKLISLLIRLFFFGTFALLAFAVMIGIGNVLGHEILQGNFGAGRILELAALLVLIVITLLLRQIRDELKKRSN